MAIPEVPSHSGGIGVADLPWPVAALVDEMQDLHADWRQDADSVTSAYASWCSAPPEQEMLRFSAYMAALDQEHAAAGEYARSVRNLELWLLTEQHTQSTPQGRSK